MTIVSPIRYDRMQLSLVSVLQSAVGSDAVVGWAYGEALWGSNFPNGQAVNLTMVGGPSFHNTSAASGTALELPSSITYQVVDAVEDRRYFIEVNDFLYSYDAVFGDSVTDIRDELVAILNMDTVSRFTATPSGADSLILTPTATGDIWQSRVSTGIAGTPTFDPSNQYFLLTKGTRVFNVAIGCFSRNRSPRTGAWDLAARCQAALTYPGNADTFADYGVGIWGKSPAVDLSELDNGHWQSRVQFDVDLAMQSVFTKPVDNIENVVVSTSFTCPSATVDITAGL